MKPLPAKVRETGSTNERALALRRRSTGQRFAVGLVCSLMLGALSPRPARTASELVVRLDGMDLPFSINDLGGWLRGEERGSSELSVWLNLLEEDSRQGVIDLLKAPLINDRSMARQILNSWAGRRLLDQVSDLVLVDDDATGQTVQVTLESLLDKRAQVTTLDLLEALPAKRVRLDLDALLPVASSWRRQLQRQQALVKTLNQLPVSSLTKRTDPVDQAESASDRALQRLTLPVEHRAQPLQIQLWRPLSADGRERRHWLVLMPGLGGSPDHFRWLGRALSRQGWPVLVLEHPGSDALAVQALLEGRRPPPGAEVLPDRLRDLDAVLDARQRGVFKLPGTRLVLGGHSLGALTALLAAGAGPETGLGRRCGQDLDDLPISNLSRLLQCQIEEVPLPAVRPPKQLAAVVGLNSFGSLLWPRRIPLPGDVAVFLSGGTLDLITPPLSEQLGLLRSLPANPATRAVLVEGASHFSPVRVEGQSGGSQGEDVFQLGEELVGVQPLRVQAQLEREIVRFLLDLELGRVSGAVQGGVEHLQVGDLHVHRLNQSGAERFLD